jgi:hypothetical protein
MKPSDDTMPDRRSASMNLIETLRLASQAKVNERLQPEMEALRNLRNCVDHYEVARREDVEVAILNEALHALGQEPVTQTSSVDNELRNLKRALFQVSPILGEPSPEPLPVVEPIPEPPLTVVEPEPEPEPSPEPVVATEPEPGLDIEHPKPPAPPKKPKPEPTALDIERAKALLDEVRSFQAGPKEDHAIRLRALFQAWVAECRMLLDKFPEEHSLHMDLVEEVIRGVAALKGTTGVTDFIKGLAFGSRENWYRIAKDNRDRVKRFDRDTEASKPKSSKPKSSPKNPKPETEAPKTSYQWPELTLLRKYMAATEEPLLLVGGSFQDPAKIESIYERFGVKVEWCPFSHDNARAVDTIAARIVSGKVSGVMLIEGFMSHKAYRRLMKAADQNITVPIAMAGKGGITSIGNALDDLERQYAVSKFKLPVVKPGDKLSEVP